MPAHRYPNACYKMLYQMDQNGRHTWATSVKTLLFKYSFQDVWLHQGVGDRNAFLREFENRIVQLYVEEWKYDLDQSSKLSLLKQIASPCTETEVYLKYVSIRKYRSSLAKLRCSSHSLRIEKGRHSGELVAQRICKLCENSGSYVLDDEYHFMIRCPALINLRDYYMPSLKDKDLNYQTFVDLMTDNSEHMQQCIATFIFHAMKLRVELMEIN